MKKMLYILMCLPLGGTIAPYIYVLYTALKLRTRYIYLTDPKMVGADILHGITLFVYSSALLLLVPTILILAYKFLFDRKGFRNLPGKFIFIIGLLLALLLHYFDPGSYLNWYFD